MRPRPLVLATLLLLAPAVPAETPLFERNLAVLRQTLPHDALIEVRVYDGAGERTEVWTAEHYAAFRARFAAGMGRDYAAGAEGVPGGPGDHQEAGEMFMDLWGTTTVNVATPERCQPLWFPWDMKLWIYPAPCLVAENENLCYMGFVCSFSYYWTIPQHGRAHGDSWFAGVGRVFNFGAPFGAIVELDGAELSENL